MKKVILIIILLSVTGLSAGSYNQSRKPKPVEAKGVAEAINDQTAKIDKLLITLKAKR